MSLPMAIHFDLAPRVDQVTLAVLPIDGFTGALVPRGVTASIKGLRDRPIVNASGMLVFINLLDPPDLPNPPAYEIEIDARGAGFFGPEKHSFTPPAANAPNGEEKRKLRVLLKPRPDYPFPSGTTLVRGVVVRGSDPVAGAAISAKPDGSEGSFEARTDAKGAFALALRPSPASAGPLSLDIHLEEGGDARDLAGRTLTIGRSHSFLEPIDLIGNNDPDFFEI